MSTAIEWSLGLPCPDHRDAIVATIVDGGHAPSGAATAEHLRRCPACRTFRDSLRTQRLLLRRVAEEQKEEAEKRARQRRLRADMREWVEEELKVRGERELADALWRCAYAILRLDDAVARGTHHEGGRGDSRNPIYSRCVVELQEKLAASATIDRSARRSTARTRERAAELLLRLNLPKVKSQEQRIELMRGLLDDSEALSRFLASPVSTTRAFIAWYYEDDRRVQPSLEHAMNTAATPVQLGHAIANLALWQSARGSFEDACALSFDALRAYHPLAFPRVNLALWATATGQHRVADGALAEAIVASGPAVFQARWPWTLLSEQLERCLSLTGATERERSRAINSIWIAYHRWGGLTRSPTIKQLEASAESDS